MQDETKEQGGTACPGCGRVFVCGMLAGQAHCWCAELPPLPVPRPQEAGCYCPECLRRLQAESAGPTAAMRSSGSNSVKPRHNAATLRAIAAGGVYLDPAIAAKATHTGIYKEQRFSDHAPLVIDYGFKL